jgi:pyruvate-ferredoxin/flavodoxin oxidoreductase
MPYGISWANSLFEDNAEFGLGIKTADNLAKEKIRNILETSELSEENKELADNWINDPSLENSLKLRNEFDYQESMQLERIKEYIMPKSVWIIGGDGWAYDIGYSGLDHALSSKENINILVLDTECYSNTGGQMSKSTRSGAVAKFASNGKKGYKKDLARIFMSYENVYVAQVSLGGNMQQTINALKEAEEHDGPSLVIAYAPCITHGIKSGMKNSINEEKLAVQSGYFPIFRYNPVNDELKLDYKDPDFDKYDELLENENRYIMLKAVNKEKAEELLNINKENAKKKFEYLKKMSNNE